MLYLLLILIIFTLDFVTKKFIRKNYQVNEKVSLYNDKIYINYRKNYGLILGVLKKYRAFIYCIMVFSIICITFIFIKFLKYKNKSLNIALIFVLSGGISNLFDRFKNGCITDFIELNFKFIPKIIFNVADIFIFLSFPLIILGELIFSKKNNI